MKRTGIFKAALLSGIGGLILMGLIAAQAMADDAFEPNQQVSADQQHDADEQYKPKTKAQLRRLLNPIQYEVTQNAGTEPAFRNAYWNNKKDGTYRCRCCDLPLFSSDTKYKSGTGWPSFWDPIGDHAVGFSKDWKLFYVRVEVHCKRCGAHLGHVFDDGPKPTGKRYCMNSAALNFVEKSDDDAKQPTGSGEQETRDTSVSES